MCKWPSAYENHSATQPSRKWQLKSQSDVITHPPKGKMKTECCHEAQKPVTGRAGSHMSEATWETTLTGGVYLSSTHPNIDGWCLPEQHPLLGQDTEGSMCPPSHGQERSTVLTTDNLTASPSAVDRSRPLSQAGARSSKQKEGATPARQQILGQPSTEGHAAGVPVDDGQRQMTVVLL